MTECAHGRFRKVETCGECESEERVRELEETVQVLGLLLEEARALARDLYENSSRDTKRLIPMREKHPWLKP